MEEFVASIENFEVQTKDAERVQRETLEKILEENEETEYLKRFGLNGRRDEETFRKCVPLASHQEFQPYIQRIADGDSSPILAAKPFTTLSLSSGTTGGKPKLLPFNDALCRSYTQQRTTALAYAVREFSVEEGMFIMFLHVASRHKAKGGADVAPITSNLFHQMLSQSSSRQKSTRKIRSCSPMEVATAGDYQQALYCHFLCGLLYSDQVQYLQAIFCHHMVQAFRTFESIWEELCADLREGVLSERVSDPIVRASVSKLIKPSPELADAIYRKCKVLQSKNWSGLIPELWPQAKYASANLTGSMEPYVGKLRHYAGDRLALVSWIYSASEGAIGINTRLRTRVESVAYAVVPGNGYFEFIPLKRRVVECDALLNSRGEELMYVESEPVRLTEVIVGELYEVVISNLAGLYRYRLGDVVKVSGFYNSTPELQFVRRKGVLLNIINDKTTESDLQLAMERASKLFLEEEKVDIVDFTSYGDLSTEPGYYVIFWELSEVPSREILQKCCNCLDQSFVDGAYVNSRKNGSIGALELRIVGRGTFTKVFEHYQSLGSTISQFKTPRCITSSNTVVLKILDDNVSARFFSSAYA
ncbi:jasmonoyl--L-amino acid synthetase JAR4-like [Aristolochia californica]|uniref:jasmonoyl--L-amino acid synthetase JAR4-like n=1 Tax=Aristolochia californica TaxID=171875 RepID=UPI0035D9878F